MAKNVDSSGKRKAKGVVVVVVVGEWGVSVLVLGVAPGMECPHVDAAMRSVGLHLLRKSLPTRSTHRTRVRRKRTSARFVSACTPTATPQKRQSVPEQV